MIVFSLKSIGIMLCWFLMTKQFIEIESLRKSGQNAVLLTILVSLVTIEITPDLPDEIEM